MANTRRSVWEIRFHALRERINSKKTNLKHKAGRMALDGQLTPEDRENLKSRIDTLDQISDDARRIETQSGLNIFLMRDN